MIINPVRFSRSAAADGTGYLTTEKQNYKHMKSCMTQSDSQRDDYNSCEIPCVLKNQIIIT